MILPSGIAPSFFLASLLRWHPYHKSDTKSNNALKLNPVFSSLYFPFPSKSAHGNLISIKAINNLFIWFFLIFFLFFSATKGIFAQPPNYTFQHLTTRDGLSSDFIRFICQDSKGFYWIGYENGFQKFDGKNFNNFLFKYKDIRGDSTPGLALPVVDDGGDVFIHNRDRLYKYRTNGKVDTITIRENINRGGRTIRAFCKDESGDIWIATSGFLYKYDKSKDSCVAWMSLRKTKSAGGYNYLIYDKYKKNFWLAMDNNIYMVDPHAQKITEPFFTEHPDSTDIPKGDWFTGCWMDSRQNLWIGLFNGSLFKYNTVTYKKELFNVFNINKPYIDKAFPVCFLEDNQKQIWIGCNQSGLFRYNEQSNSFHLMHINNNKPSAFHYNYYVSAMYQDNEGNIWVGTDKGINIFNPSQQQFNIIDEHSPITEFQKTEITKIFETRSGDILVGTWGKGWWQFDKDFRLRRKFFSNVKLPGSAEQRKNFVWCFGEDPYGKIWIGYQHGLIGIFDTRNQRINYMDVPEFERKTIRAIKCDTKGNVWFGLHSGALGKWDVLHQKFFVYPLPFNTSKAISDLLLDKNGDLWISTDGNGFYCFHPVTGKITDHYYDTGYNSVFDNEVHGISEINDSIMAIANASKGFILFNRKRKTFTSYTDEKGLQHSNIYSTAIDKENNLWIAAYNALMCMSNDNKKVFSFDEEQGLYLKGFKGAISKLRNGTMAIPAATGFVYFNPENLKKLPVPPNITITGFSIFNNQLPIDSLLATGKEIRLHHTQNFFSINYASISFQQRNSIRYYYQLENVDQTWVNAGNQLFANYTDLHPGHYTFKVKCENRDGLFSKNITTLSIYINPPWWSTYWAYALYILAAGGIVYIIFRNRVRKIRHDQQAQINTMIATQEEERKRISRDLHDDVGTKLSALKLFLSSLRDKAKSSDNEELKILAANSEQFVSETIRDVRGLLLNLSPSTLEEFGYTTAVEGLINKINDTKQIHFNLIVFGMQQRLPTKYELALYRITQELINNVLKHAEAKNVSLQIGRRENKIILMIEDDGKGFDINTHKEGYGLHNLEVRTKLLQGVMTIDSRIGTGTSILIEIPDNFN